MSEPSQQIATILLRSAESIVDRFRRINKAQAKNFNIFDVLGRATDEVYGHSAIIGDLLDPNGTHGQGDRFLRLFFNMLRTQTGIPDEVEKLLFDSRNWKVVRERAFTLTEGEYAGCSGRIDIVIECHDAILIIENKIDAGDQDAQMERYRQYGEKIHPGKTYLVYLTPHGDAPSEESVAEMPKTNRKQIVLLSYGDIGEWIEECIASTALLPHLRETLSQYNRLVNRLSKGIQDKEMTMEIAKNIENPTNFRAAVQIQNAITEIKIKVQLQFWKKLRDTLTREIQIEREDFTDFCFSEALVEKYYSNSRKGDYGIGFRIKQLDKRWQLVFIVGMNPKVYYGFYLFDGDDYSKNQQDCDLLIIKAVKSLRPGRNDSYVPGRYWYAEPELNFEDFDDNCIDLLDGKKLDETIVQISQQIKDLIKDFHIATKQCGYKDKQ